MASVDSPKLDFTTFHNTIDGKLTATSTTRRGVNPATKELINAEVPVSTLADVDNAVAAAQVAFKKWSKTTFEERRRALHAFADGLDHYKEEFADLLVLEQGKPLFQANMEVDLAVKYLKTLSQLELPEEVLEVTEEHRIVGRYTPLGVVGGIIPWNSPVILACGKIASAIYTGNAVIIKPSPFTPYCDLKLGELGIQYFPPGVLQVLSGGDDLGPMMTVHPGIDKISFTGSIETGKKVMESCAKTLKRVTLELGGNDAAIVCEDVDIDTIISKVTIASFLCSSQICMMIKRLYIHEKIYDQFRDALVNHVKALKSGEGHTPDVFFGPIQNSMQYEKVKALMQDINKEGVKSALGGEVKDSEGYFITPTIIDNPPETSRIVTEEPFGPVLPLLKWVDEDDVIARANNTKTGLGASVWSKDSARAEKIARQLEAGNVWVNTHFDISPKVPVGGHKWSGIGSEFGVSGLKAYCNLQSLWLCNM
ncbi:betaine aldehyde dehydrogenase [Nannizzia gypsea CBS 118893]|uniref:aldehyde dehydrogenase (NAD(+)) n=1 Tax=Arthroderma gypseum (strain ATCC MYA-4604 / CBS 118893) TaxID=535722 RepID=E4V5C9_ARTGP|nr:betaine aldehyde dehydrogenase [Nannizzia gypsea CBS 118893]EFR05203.1 betaine aldehyde dehydrogenase [Nannizzia gypsea CBS 118893]